MARTVHRSRRFRLAVAATSTLVIPACSSESEPRSSSSPTSSASITEPTNSAEPSDTEPTTAEEPFGNRASHRCTELINELDPAIGTAAQDASIGVLYAATSGIEPTDAELTEWGDAMRARVAQLGPLVEALGALEGAPDPAAWQIVLDHGTEQITYYNGRIAVTEVDEWADASDVLVAAGGLDERLEPSFEQLDLVRRDCEGVFTYPGNPAEYEQFLDAAAETCSAIVSRRRANGFDDRENDIVFGAIEEALTTEQVTVTPELVAAVDERVAEWTTTLSDLRGVPTDDVSDEAEWAVTLAWVQDRIDAFSARAAALASGDQTELLAVFTPGALIGVPGPGDWAALALDRRDCRAIIG